MPAVSVVIPVFNRRRYIAQAIESVLAQTLQDLELIVVDDGSTDGTPDFVAATFGDRVVMERMERNEGRSAARNRGWARAKSDLVAFLDSDDIWLPKKLERQLPRFGNPEVQLVHTWVGKIDRQARPLPAASESVQAEFRKALVRGYDFGEITQTWCRMYTSSVVLRRDLLERTGGFDTNLDVFEDWDLFWRIALVGRVDTVAESLVLHRDHPGCSRRDWDACAGPWLYLNRKHLVLLEAVRDGHFARRAANNLSTNMAIGEYWRGDTRAAWNWLRRAGDAGDGNRPRAPWYVWGAPVLHRWLPRRVAGALEGILGADPYSGGEVSLVIDDGPSDETPRLIDTLAAGGHLALLFILGCNVKGREQVLIDALQQGFVLGNHSYTHPRFSTIDAGQAHDEIARTEELIESLHARAGIPRAGRWFRFPYLDSGGPNSGAFRTLLAGMGFAVPPAIRARAHWWSDQGEGWPTTVPTFDWELPPSRRFRRRVRKAKAGDVIEFHDKAETVPPYVRILSEELNRKRLRAVVPAAEGS